MKLGKLLVVFSRLVCNGKLKIANSGIYAGREAKGKEAWGGRGLGGDGQVTLSLLRKRKRGY
jgi:hypothetical protein